MNNRGEANNSIDTEPTSLKVSFQDLSISNTNSTSIDFCSTSFTLSENNSIGSKLSSDGGFEGKKMESLNVELEKAVEYVDSENTSFSSVSYCNSADPNEASFRGICASKPHKGNDIRWDAIQCVKGKNGELGLAHFRLLKKLGFGDIGSVYLAELRGMGCLFAMKVMDKGMLAGRKKVMRAQTEREILGLLDHPFLPTLYSHFETEKFSCLLMEFCSGGDLHLLRQRQPGKHFTEQAARFVFYSSFWIFQLCSCQFDCICIKIFNFYLFLCFS